MNDEKKVELQKEFKNIKIKGQDKKSYTITITDKEIDIKDKKDGDEVKIAAKIKEEKDANDKTITLKGKLNLGLYRDSISIKEIDGDATLKELESEIKPYSKIWTKPMTIGTIVVVLLLVIGGIWWWISSSKSEDKEEESL